jgi:LacI family transcriptional regulator
LEISNGRLNGYLKALKTNKLKVEKEVIIHCDFNQDFAFFATQGLLTMKKRPDAIFTVSDRMAIGAMVAIKKKGSKMPQDIGLAGFNDEPVLSLVSPEISSVEQPSFEMGKIAAKLFIETMHHNGGEIVPVQKILKTKLFIRASSNRLVYGQKP